MSFIIVEYTKQSVEITFCHKQIIFCNNINETTHEINSGTFTTTSL